MKLILTIILLLSFHTLYVFGQDNQQHLIQLCQKGKIEEAHNFIVTNYQLDSLSLLPAYLYGSVLSKKFNSSEQNTITVEYRQYLKRYIYDFLDIAHELEKNDIAIYFLAADLSKMYVDENNSEIRELYKRANEKIKKCNHLNDDKFCVLTVRYYDYLVNNGHTQEAYKLSLSYLQHTSDSKILYKACAYQLVGKCLKLKGEFKESINNLHHALDLYHQIKDYESFTNYYDLQTSLADAYLKNKEIDLSYQHANESLVLSKKQFGEQSLQYIQSLNLLTSCLIEQNENKKAFHLSERAISLYKNKGYKNNQIESRMYLNSKYLKSILGIHEKDEDEFTQYSNKQDYYTSLFMSGKRDEILTPMLDLKKEYDNSTIPDKDRYIQLVDMLSIIYQENGDLKNWDNVLRSSENILESHYKDISESLSYAPFLGSKGLLSFSLKNYYEAIRLFEKAKYIYESHQYYCVDYITLLNNLALSYMEIGNNTYAKMIIDYSADLYNQKITQLSDSSTSSSIALLNNIGYIYMSIGDMDKAEMIFNKVIDNAQKDSTLIHNSKLAYNNLAYIYTKRHDYAKAYDIFSILCSQEKNKDRLNTYLQNKILTSYFFENPDLYKDLEMYNQLLKSSIVDAFKYFSYNEREHIWTQYSRELVMVHNLFSYKINLGQYVTSSYDNLLFTKHMLLNSANALQILSNVTDDKNFREQYHKYHHLNEMIFSSKRSNHEQTSLIKERDEIEKDLLTKIPSYSKDFLNKFPTWKNVRDRLDQNEISIEFTLFPVLQDLDVVDVYYGALILKKGWTEPKLIQLAEQQTLENICTKRHDNPSYLDYLYSEESPLFDILYLKILPFLKPNDIIYYSPCGIINNLKLGAMRYQGRPISEIYTFKRISSTGNLLERRKQFNINNCKSASIYGGINYNTFDSIMVKESQKYTYHNDTFTDSMSIRGRKNYRDSWNYLPGTLIEGHTVRNLLQQKHIEITMFSGNVANEESFKAFSYNSPDLIHIATHGFCFSSNNDIQKNQYLKSFSQTAKKDNALQFTGLLLSGANNAWISNKRTNGIEDGILTASEISNLNLSNTKLVVLSACDTGLGDIDIVDGVIGLQKAFKKAGVETIMMSLWKVDDKVTNQFMTEFYKEIINNKTPHDALKKAETVIRKEYPNPFYWASFVILD